MSDESTERLTTRFYVTAASAPAGASMSAAQRDLLKQPQYAHPFYWAGFNLIGNSR